MSVHLLAATGTPTLPLGALDHLRALSAQTLDAVLWDHDVERVATLTAAAVGSPVAIVIPRVRLAVAAPLQETRVTEQLAIYVREHLQERPVEIPAQLRAEVPISRRGEVVGSVLLLADASGTGVRDALANECLQIAATAATSHLAALELRASVEQAVHGSLLEQVLGPEEIDARTLVRRAARLGCDLSEGAIALCMRLTGDRPGHVVALIADSVPGALAGQVDERLYALLPLAGGGSVAVAEERARRIAERLRAHGTLGVSSIHRDPARLRHALEEAEFMLDVEGLADTPSEDSAAVSGTYRLLLRLMASHPDEVNALYEATVSPLVRYDEHHRTDLVETLATYLELNGNMNATAAKIYAHRHTIAYRLDRIRELTGLDPATSEHRERLGLGLKAFRLLARERRA